jgi:hypothetical protein
VMKLAAGLASHLASRPRHARHLEGDEPGAQRREIGCSRTSSQPARSVPSLLALISLRRAGAANADGTFGRDLSSGVSAGRVSLAS